MSSPSRHDLEEAIQVASNPDFDTIKVIYKSNSSWPFSQHSTYPQDDNQRKPPHISVLDSSWNPPHLAHFGIASSTFPPITPVSSLQETMQSEYQARVTGARSINDGSHGKQSDPGEYSARLLLLAIRNVDKTLKPGDVTYLQRLEMTILLAEYLQSEKPLSGGIAVGVVHDPTFVGKSKAVHRYLRDSSPTPASSSSSSLEVHHSRPILTFLVGTDTLVRFFDPKYYPPDGMIPALQGYFSASPEGDGSILVSARRGIGETSEGLVTEILKRDVVRPWAEKGSVRIMGSAGEGREDISSTAVRDAVKSGDMGTLRTLVIPEIAEYILQHKLYTS